MKREEVRAILRGLNEEGVRYLVAGGLAVVAYGYLRLTADLDLALAMDRENLSKAIAAFQRLGYRPRLPVRFEQLADDRERQSWIRDKYMVVFSLLGPESASTPVDIMVELPFSFEDEYPVAEWIEMSSDVKFSCVRLETLIRMKEQAGRNKDLVDLEKLRQIREMRRDAPQQ